jgi:hypothetical protein
VQSGLGRPIVIIDISSSPRLSAKYVSLISALFPRSIYIHSKEDGMDIYNSVQEAVHFGFLKILEETKSDDLILFLEDDIIFSVHFIEKLRALEIKPDAGLITLYLPGNEYSSTVIDPHGFYGTQCVLFPRRSIEEIVNNWADIKTRIPPGYDIRWSRFLAERGYKLYSTDNSYVQHQQAISRLHGHTTHMSNKFLG